eukprot:13632828-Alexandrium_andersonii.AAC.1
MQSGSRPSARGRRLRQQAACKGGAAEGRPAEQAQPRPRGGPRRGHPARPWTMRPRAHRSGPPQTRRWPQTP